MSVAFTRNDLTIYEQYAEEWWDPESPRFRSLQNISPFRLSLIQEWTGSFAGKEFVDLGCGGGLLSIPLIEAGAIVTGVDRSEGSVQSARKRSKGNGTFLCEDIRNTSLASSSADVVLLADVLDHIEDYEKAVGEAARIVRQGGAVVAFTINRTVWSYLGAILLGEGLGYIPPGTHDHRLFIQPEELQRVATRCGLSLQAITGEGVCIAKTLIARAITLSKSSNLSVAYGCVFLKG